MHQLHLICKADEHYNPIIDEEVMKTWNLPGKWSLIAQMPFGEPMNNQEKNVPAFRRYCEILLIKR